MSDISAPKDPAAVAIEKGVEEIAETARHFLGKLLDQGLEQGGGLISDTVAFWRFKNKVNLALKTKQFLDSKGIDPRKVLPKVALPILEAGSLEIDEEMQDRWAALLANAATAGERVPPAFPRILADLSARDAHVLEFLYANCPYRFNPRRGYQPPSVKTIMNHFSIDPQALGVMVGILTNHNLILSPPFHRDPFEYDEHLEQGISLTSLGVAFVSACKPPEVVEAIDVA
jgi:hypothetical protein